MAATRTDDPAPPLAEAGRRQPAAGARGPSPGGSRKGGGNGDVEHVPDDDSGASDVDADSASPDGPPLSHHVDEPRDEGPVESLGRAIGEVVLGSDEEEREAREGRP